MQKKLLVVSGTQCISVSRCANSFGRKVEVAVEELQIQLNQCVMMEVHWVLLSKSSVSTNTRI